MRTQNGLYGKASQFGVIVFIAKMAEPNMAKSGRRIIDKGLSTLVIAQMPIRSADALLQMAGISTLRQFLRLIVGFQDKVLRLRNTLLDLIGDVTTVSDQAKAHTFAYDTITRAVSTIMGDGEGADGKLTYLLSFSFLQIEEIFLVNLSAHTPVAMDSSVYVRRGKDRNVAITTQRAYRLDMVGMVMGEDDMLDMVEFETILVEMLFKRTNAYATVYHQTVCVGE